MLNYIYMYIYMYVYGNRVFESCGRSWFEFSMRIRGSYKKVIRVGVLTVFSSPFLFADNGNEIENKKWAF